MVAMVPLKLVNKYLQEPHQVLKLKSQEKKSVPGMGSRKLIILKYTQSFYRTQDYPTCETILLKPSPLWDKGNHLTLGPSGLPVPSEREEKKENCETLLKITVQGPRHTDRLRLNYRISECFPYPIPYHHISRALG